MNLDYSLVTDHDLDGPDAVAFSTRKGLKHGYLCARMIAQSRIQGAIVECGVAQGAQVGMMARGFASMGESREFHLFDSFEGIPMAGPNDAEQPGIGKPRHDVNAPLRDRLVSSGVSIGTVGEVMANLGRWMCNGKFSAHKGWFQDTVPAKAASIGPIAILRLDGDLYESTEVCLRHLAPLVVPGGLIIIDDYALAGCAKAVHEYRDAHGIDAVLHLEDIGGAIIATWIA